MFDRLVFRVSPLSMLCLFAVSVLITFGVRYGSVYGWLPTGALFRNFSLDTATFFYSLVRGAVIFIVAVGPFDEHLVERPSLIWVVAAVSFAGMLAPWLILGSYSAFTIVLAITSHIMGFGILLLLWSNMVAAAAAIKAEHATGQPA